MSRCLYCNKWMFRRRCACKVCASQLVTPVATPSPTQRDKEIDESLGRLGDLMASDEYAEVAERVRVLNARRTGPPGAGCWTFSNGWRVMFLLKRRAEGEE